MSPPPEALQLKDSAPDIEAPSPTSDANAEKNEQLEENDIVEETKKTLKFKITILMICLALVVVSMDSVIVAATLPAITVALKGESLEAFWVGTSYLLAQTVPIPLYGAISGIFGRKGVMIFSICLFTLGSILCATAQSMSWLIGARVVQGLGGGGCLALATVIVSDITTLRERPKFFAMLAFSWALGTNIGVPAGGAIGEYTSWRWVFWINLPICGISGVGLVWALHLHQEISSLRSKMARIDYLGVFVFVAATTSLLYGLTTGGTTAPWNSANVLAPLIIGVCGLAAFVMVELKVSNTPMVPLRIFSNRTANTGFFGAFIHGLVLWSFAYYLIIFGRVAMRSSSLQPRLSLAGKLFYTFRMEETLTYFRPSAPVALSAVFAGILAAKTLRFQKATWVAWILLTTGTGLNALMKPNSGAGVLYGLRVIAAVGGGCLFQFPLFAVQATSKDDDLGIATASLTFFRSIGQAFGVAIGGTVFQNQFDYFVTRAISSGKIPHNFTVTGAEAAGAYARIGGFPEPVIDAYRYIYADSLRTVWYVTTGIAGAGLLSSLLVRNESLDRGNKSSQTFKDDATFSREDHLASEK